MPAASTDRAAGRAAPRKGALPTLLVIGIQKCGTSSLHYYLDLHPEVAMSAPKELNYLRGRADPGRVRPRYDRELIAALAARPDSSTEDWYRRHFDPAVAVRGEASPSYTAPWFPEAADRAAALVPGAKLIALVRNPIEQVRSAWRHMVSLGREGRPLAEAVLPGGIYLERVRYRRALGPWLERFGSERALVIDQAALRARRRETMARVFAFAGVDPGFYSPRLERERNVTASRGPARALLGRAYRSRVARPAYRLPQEVKWRLERGLSRRSGTAGPAVDAATRATIIEAAAPDFEWLADEHGIDTSAWTA